jgi:hypothetical protein
MLRKLMIALWALAMLSSGAMAQGLYSLASWEVVSVPFSFAVGDRTLPAGTYTFQVNLERRMVVIESEDRHTLMFHVNFSDLSKEPAHGQMVFKHSGDAFILTKVRVQGSTSEADLVLGKREKQIARAERPEDNVVVLAGKR